MRMMSLGALVGVLAIWTVQMAAAATVTSSSIGHYIRFRGWRHQTKAEDGRQSLQESHVFKPAIPKVQSAPVPQTIEGQIWVLGLGVESRHRSSGIACVMAQL